jgi:succinate dehydrogenase / fumarate reductase flavoprotein subunit
MESWDVVIIGSGPAALRAAIASSDVGTKPIVIDCGSVGSSTGLAPVSGIAISFDEVDSTTHRDDTILSGGDSSDKLVTARICGQAVSILAELENWGLVLQRREGGLPFASSSSGHSRPRLVGCGDSTSRELTRILEEQAMKRGIVRRTDLQTISLVMDNKQIRGITVLNLQTGEIFGIQAKAVILATDGHQGLWSNFSEGPGTGAALAASAGIQLQGMSNTPTHYLTVRGTNLHLPVDILSAGGRYRTESGEDVSPGEDVSEDCVLDLRTLNQEAKVWYAQTIRRIEERTGLDPSSDVIPLMKSVAFTLGGAPVDEDGRVTFKSNSMWYTGLYAAGRSANTGMHGEGYLPGNLQLEDLVTGEAAGSHAGAWVKDIQFAASDKISRDISKTSNKINAYYSQQGVSVGEVSKKLSSIVKNINGNNNAALSTIKELKETQISLTDDSRVMNTELLNAIQVDAMFSVAESLVKTS